MLFRESRQERHDDAFRDAFLLGLIWCLLAFYTVLTFSRMSTKTLKLEKAVPLPDLPSAEEMCREIRNAEPTDVLFKVAKELTGIS